MLDLDSEFEKELEILVNKYCKENESSTPDFLLAEMIVGVMKVFAETIKAREKWYGVEMRPGREFIQVDE